jgi:hypothetical protein
LSRLLGLGGRGGDGVAEVIAGLESRRAIGVDEPAGLDEGLQVEAKHASGSGPPIEAGSQVEVAAAMKADDVQAERPSVKSVRRRFAIGDVQQRRIRRDEGERTRVVANLASPTDRVERLPERQRGCEFLTRPHHINDCRSL